MQIILITEFLCKMTWIMLAEVFSQSLGVAATWHWYIIMKNPPMGTATCELKF